MGAWLCGGCGTRYRVSLSRCPRCTGTTFQQEGTMPKISKNSGATYAGAGEDGDSPPAPAATELVDVTPMDRDPVNDPEYIEVPARAELKGEHGPELVVPPEGGAVVPAPGTEPDAEQQEGGEQPSPGDSSSTSTEKPEPKQKQSAAPRRNRARTTGSRSGAGQTDSSTARSTGGGQTGPSSATDGEAG
jgi:hypothetical protein